MVENCLGPMSSGFRTGRSAFCEPFPLRIQMTQRPKTHRNAWVLDQPGRLHPSGRRPSSTGIRRPLRQKGSSGFHGPLLNCCTDHRLARYRAGNFGGSPGRVFQETRHYQERRVLSDTNWHIPPLGHLRDTFRAGRRRSPRPFGLRGRPQNSLLRFRQDTATSSTALALIRGLPRQRCAFPAPSGRRPPARLAEPPRLKKMFMQLNQTQAGLQLQSAGLR